MKNKPAVIKNTYGASILELAIALPVLLILMMGVVDLGLAIRQYLGISRASYEGIRYIAGLEGNRQGLTIKNESKCLGKECTSAKVNCNGSGGNFVDSKDCRNLIDTTNRIKHLLSKNGFTDLSETEVSLKIVLSDASYKLSVPMNGNKYQEVNKIENEKFNIIEATIETPYNSILPFLNNIKLKKKMTFADLYKDE